MAAAVPFLIKLVVALVISYIVGQMSKPRSYSTPALEDVGMELKANTRSTSQNLLVGYGTRRQGGNDVFIQTADYHNKTLWIIQCLGEGPIEGIAQTDGGIDKIYIDDQLYTEINAKNTTTTLVDYVFYSGTADQTLTGVSPGHDANLVAEFLADCPNYNDNLQYTAFILFKFYYDENVFRGLPKRQVDLKLRTVYDFTTDTEDVWTTSPVLALYDYFTATRYGLGIDATNIDVISWEEAYDYAVSKNFTCNILLNTSSGSIWGNVDKILKLFRGTINFFDDKYYLRFADLNEEVSVLTIEDDMIWQDGSGKSSIKMSQPGRYDKPTGMRVTYIDSNSDYTEDSKIIGEEDGIVESLALDGCTDPEMAGILATYELERMILNRSLSVKLKDEAVMLDPHDIVTVNSTALAIEDQVMRVVAVTYGSDGFVNVGLQYEDQALYNDIFDINEQEIYRVNLPDPSEPSIIYNPQIEEETYDYRLRTFSRLNITYELPEDPGWFSHVEVWLSLTGTEDDDFKMQFTSSSTGFSIDPVEEGVNYYVKLIPVNIWGTKANFGNAAILSATVQGVQDPPESLTGLAAIPGDNSLLLMASKIDNPDIQAYEFRYGPQWIGGIFLGQLLAPNYPLKQIKPGFFQFTANTLGTNGLYGVHPAYAAARIPPPNGYTKYDNLPNDTGNTYSSGTFNNTEQYYYAGQYWLKCSHNLSGDGTSVTLTGTYTSPTYDIGADNVNFYYTFIDCGESRGIDGISVTGLGTSWEELIPYPNTWQDLFPLGTESWAETFEINVAPTVRMEIQWKENLNDKWNIIDRAEMCSGVVRARYYRTKIYITDPNNEVNAIVRQHKLTLLKGDIVILS